jgi:NADH dehydrogenase FAD-containing subunit
MLEDRNIKYTTNCRVQRVNPDSVAIQYYDDSDEVHNEVLPSQLTMLIPPFRGINAWKSVPGLTDDNGMVLVDQHQQSLQYPNIFGVGVCVHIDPIEKTRVPTGVPKTGYMIESMGTAAVNNIRDMIEANKHSGGPAQTTQELHHVPILNGLCITDFGHTGAVFVAMPQIPPRIHDYTITGTIGVLAKMAFEKYFLHKIQSGDTDPYYEKYALALIGVKRTVAK